MNYQDYNNLFWQVVFAIIAIIAAFIFCNAIGACDYIYNYQDVIPQVLQLDVLNSQR